VYWKFIRARQFEIERKGKLERFSRIGLEEGMKSRLSSTITMLAFGAGIAMLVIVGIAFHAGREAGTAASIFDFGNMPSGASGALIFAVLFSFVVAALLMWRMGSAVGTPVQQLAEFSERLAAGDPRARADVQADNELGLIAENLNRAVAKVSKATSNQEANESLQRSITELLAVINQVARGDLAQRGKVTNDALGNVTDSINYMLDNFTKVLERVRKAAMEVTACSNNILVAADEM